MLPEASAAGPAPLIQMPPSLPLGTRFSTLVCAKLEASKAIRSEEHTSELQSRLPYTTLFRSQFHERIPKISLSWKAIGIERRIKGAIALEEIDVARGIRSWAGATHPDASFAAVRHQIQHARLCQT